MTLKELINQNFGISGRIAIKDIDSLDDKDITVFKSIKDPKIRSFMHWEVIQVYPAYSEVNIDTKLEKIIKFFKGKKRANVEENVERAAVLVISVCHHYIIDEPEDDEDDLDEDSKNDETPKNYK